MAVSEQDLRAVEQRFHRRLDMIEHNFNLLKVRVERYCKLFEDVRREAQAALDSLNSLEEKTDKFIEKVQEWIDLSASASPPPATPKQQAKPSSKR